MYDDIYFWEGIDNGRVIPKEPLNLDDIGISTDICSVLVHQA